MSVVVMVVSREDTVDMSVVVMVVSREDWRPEAASCLSVSQHNCLLYHQSQSYYKVVALLPSLIY